MHFYDFGSLLGSLLETIVVTCWVPFLHRFLEPQKTSKNGGAGLLHPLTIVHALPSSDSSPLVEPLRGAPDNTARTWQSQSFPEQQTSVLSQQQTFVLSQQQTSASAFITQHQHSSHGSSSGKTPVWDRPAHPGFQNSQLAGYF